MNKVIKFDFDYSPVGVVADEGTIWFLAKDLASILRYEAANRLVGMLKQTQWRILNIEKIGTAMVVNDSGLDSAITQSQVGEADKVRFRDWLAAHVFPKIWSIFQASMLHPARFIVSLDQNGRYNTQALTGAELIAAPEQLPGMIRDSSMIPDELLPELYEALSIRMKMTGRTRGLE